MIETYQKTHIKINCDICNSCVNSNIFDALSGDYRCTICRKLCCDECAGAYLDRYTERRCCHKCLESGKDILSELQKLYDEFDKSAKNLLISWKQSAII